MTSEKTAISSEAKSEINLESQPKSKLKSENVQILIATFLTVFVAELGDKTQITILMIAAQAKSPIIVFFGAAIALVLTSFLGVMAGTWLHKHLSPKLLNTLAGFSFLCLAIGLVWDVVQ
jgi:Ca2+/H+ antiporter, TMEM165/GDT1 family